VSEAAPGTGDDPVFATPARAELAQSLRELIEASMTARTVSEADLARATEHVRAATAALGRPPAPVRPGTTPSSHGDYLPRSPVVGESSPLSPRFDWSVDAGRVRVVGQFGAAYEGPPGCVHGGMIALAFDEVLGIVNMANDCPGMTGTLAVRYRSPTPLYAPLVFDAWLERRDGRRIQSKAQLFAGDRLCAEADGLFVQPRPEWAAQYFGSS
jgi:acyl-coenzyme A thioesterase PaaI-like protein